MNTGKTVGLTPRPLSNLRLKPRLWEDVGGYLFLLPWLVGFVTLFGGPMIASFGISLLKTDFQNEATFVGPVQYRTLLSDPLAGLSGGGMPCYRGGATAAGFLEPLRERDVRWVSLSQAPR